MLTNAAHLKGFTIHATDGELGKVDDFYFDDENWAIRYLTVETGGWLGGRQVLISPISVLQTDSVAKRLDVGLTKKQVEDSPKIDTHRPISRQHESVYFDYYGYPDYWSGPNLWGPSYFPSGLAGAKKPSRAAVANRILTDLTDSHLRSVADIIGHTIDAADGEIGHVAGFVVDDEAWAIRYMEVATKNWWPGKKVLVSPTWIESVSWANSKVYVGLFRDAIQGGPAYDESKPVTRAYENQLYLHYGRAPYWVHQTRSQADAA